VLQGVPAQNGYVPMPAFASQLSDQQVADVVNYVRTNWGNSAPSNATPEMVARRRH
jgi:mono/diheme cytochrome c family protein